MAVRPPRCIPLALAVAAAFAAHAQQAPKEDKPEAKLEPVFVTGERAGSFRSGTVQVGTFRDMNPLEVPLTSNVVTRAVIDEQSATTLYGALRNTAGVTRSQLSGSTYDNIAIRGILVENRGNYRLNGSLPVVNLIDIPLEDKQRVEVLKGASSLYYGFVPPSGIVNLVTKRAEDKPVTAVNVWGNEYGQLGAHVDVGRRFGDAKQFGARVNVAGGREDIGIDRYSGNRSLGAAALDWRASDRVSVRVDLEDYRKDSSEQAAIALLPAVNGVVPLPAVPANTTNLAGEWQRYDVAAKNALVRADFKVADNWSFTAEAGQARMERDRNFSQFQGYNLATGAGTLRISYARGQEYRNDNYRGELFGRIETGALTHEVSIGYTANKRFQDSRVQPAVNVAQNLYNPVEIAQIADPAGTDGTLPSEIRDRGWYAFDRLLVGDKWQAMLGARGSNYKSVTTTATYDADEVNPFAAVIFKPRPDVALYVSYLEGLEEGGTAPANRANAGEVLAPAKSKQTEIGAKLEFGQGALLQLAGFEIERPSSFVDAQNRFVLNGLARYRGLEMAASGEIDKQWSLVASALLMRATQENAANAATFGKMPENTPRRTASLFVLHQPAWLPGLGLSAGAFYVGQRAANNENQAFVGGATTWSLGASYVFKRDGVNYRAQATLDNAGDKQWWSTAGNGLLGVGLPRVFKVALGAAW